MRRDGRRAASAGRARRVGGLATAGALAGVLVSGTALVVVTPIAPAGATSSHPTIHVSTAKVAGVGTVLTTGSGLTLYHNMNDTAGTAVCTGGCATIWPPMLAPKGAHIAGPKGVKGLSLMKVNNHWQVAFHHIALYRFSGDKKKGQAKGQGFENTWFAVMKSGIPAAAPVVTTTTLPPTTTTQAPRAVTTTPPTQTPVTQPPPPPTTTVPPTTTTTTSGGTGGVGF